jgi:hypothetical protein
MLAESIACLRNTEPWADAWRPQLPVGVAAASLRLCLPPPQCLSARHCTTVALLMVLLLYPSLQVFDCNVCTCQRWYVDTSGRLHPLHAPQLCLDIASGKTTVTTCSVATTQSWAGLGEWPACSCMHAACSHFWMEPVCRHAA